MSMLRLESLSAEQLDALPREKTVIFLAVGPWEDHGPHLPLGTDTLQARHLVECLALRMEKELPGWTALVAPALPLGVDSNTRRLALTVRGYVLRDFLVDFCSGLARAGFFHFVCVSGHPGPRQLTAIEEAGRILRRTRSGGWIRRAIQSGPRVSLVSASSALVDRDVAFRSPLWPDAAEHGGTLDTSLALVAGHAADPRQATLPEARRPDSFFERAWKRITRSTRGYWGDPARAQVETGSRAVADQVDTIFPKLRAVWEGSNPDRTFRSGYGIFPTNGSYFRAWIYALLLAALICVWVYLNVSTMVGA